MADVILVLGMHRSGTSSVTGVLNMLGAAAPKTLMPATAANERGYWESRPIFRFHNDLLGWAGSSWSDWRRFCPSANAAPGIGSFKERARRLFEAEFEDHPLVVLKDPRICRFTPFWTEVLAEIKAKPHVVIVVRSPLEVAKSLRARDGFSLTTGLLLWSRHMLDAEFATRFLPRVVISWDDFLSDWRSAAETISDRLGILWPRLSAPIGLEIDQYLNTDLRHHKSDDTALIRRPDIHSWTLQTYDAMLALIREPDSDVPRVVLDDVRGSFELFCEMFGNTVLRYETEKNQLRARVEVMQAERNHWFAYSQRLETCISNTDAEEGQTGAACAPQTEDEDQLRRLAQCCASRAIADAWDRTDLQALRDALRALDANPVLPPHTPLRIFSGDIIFVDLRDRRAQELFVFKSTKPDITEFVLRALREGQVAYDVGAREGYFSVIMAKAVGPQGRVLAFEPTPAACTLLRQSAAQFHHVEVHEASIGDNVREAVYTAMGPTHSFSSKREVDGLDTEMCEVSAERLRAPQTTLDEIWDKTGHTPNFIKIGAEGAELSVILGMARMLETARPTIAIELSDSLHLQEADAQNSRMLIDLLGRHDYRPYEFKCSRLVPHKIIEEHPFNYTNVIFLPLEDGKVGSNLR